MKKIAIVGSGIAGISTAYYLNKLGYDVSLFESNSYFGGHTNTIDVNVEGKEVAIDTGFLVHNDRTYPNLINFFTELGISTHESDMSFSVNRVSENIVWAGTTLFSVFCQIKNLFSIRFYRFLLEVLRFNRESKIYLGETKNNLEISLGDLLTKYKYSEDFQRWYLLPMGGCIWSTPTDEMLKFPAHTFLVFCMNHGLLQIFNRPQWKTVMNGCRTYVVKALSTIDKKYLNEAVTKISYINDQVVVKTEKREERFDYCFLTSHPPQIIKMMSDSSVRSYKYLERIKYQPNVAVLHTDQEILPKYKSAWAAWNYTSLNNSDGDSEVSVSYLINQLQPLPVNTPVIVTLNPVKQVNRDKILREINYQHPLFDEQAVSAQGEITKYQGEKRTYYAGAWMRYGFHEDGIWSAKLAIEKFLKDIGDSREFSVL